MLDPLKITHMNEASQESAIWCPLHVVIVPSDLNSCKQHQKLSEKAAQKTVSRQVSGEGTRAGMAYAEIAKRPIDAASIHPSRELEDSTRFIDDWPTLNAIYEEQGYLLLRSVLHRPSIDHALRRMMAVMARHGIVDADATEPLWTGKPLIGRHEESAEFGGICQELVSTPANMSVFEKVLGEPVAAVPIVQYRSYPPNSPLLMVHQDGFYSPGIKGFRPVWIPLTTIDESVGGLMLALGLHREGPLHRTDMPPSYPILAGVIPEDAWATTTFYPGDVLVVHPWTPHVGAPNTSNRVRFSIDTRVQSAHNPCVLLGDVIAVDSTSVTLRTARGEKRLALDAETFIRTEERAGVRVPFAEVVAKVPLGLRVVASFEGERALMLRRASEA